jgi:hypothetical protein
MNNRWRRKMSEIVREIVVPANPGFFYVHLPTEAMEISELEECLEDGVPDDEESRLTVTPIVAWIVYNPGLGAVVPVTAFGGQITSEGGNAILCPDGQLITEYGEAYSSREEFVQAACEQTLQSFRECAAEQGLTLAEWDAKIHEEGEAKRKTA